jgi:hypothetical protein
MPSLSFYGFATTPCHIAVVFLLRQQLTNVQILIATGVPTFHQARYQKERAANRRNEILLDQLCTEIEVKAVAVQNQQVLSHSATLHIGVHLMRRVSGSSAKICAKFFLGWV